MYLIVVGCGPVGASLIELAVHDGHSVALIESNKDRAVEATQRFGCQVIHADIARGGVLEEAGADRADALAATTGDDSANLMAIFLAAERGIKTLVSVVNEKEHQQLFERLGVHVLVDPEVIVARHLYGLLRQPSVEDVVALPGGGQVFHITVSSDAPLQGKTLAQADQEGLLPREFLIVALERNKSRITPDGQTRLLAGDLLTVYTPEPVSDLRLRIFTG